MTKDGFIRELEECLQGEVASGQIAETLDYYRTYISDRIREGETEENVLQELGSPRLIARSVIDAYGIDDHIVVNEEYVQDEDGSQGEMYDEEGNFVRHRRYEGSTVLTQRIVGIAVLVGIVLLFGFLINLLLPVILLGAAVWLILRLFSGRS